MNIDWFEFTEGDDTGGPSTVVHIKKRNAPNFAIDGNRGAQDFQSVYLWEANEANVNQQWIEIERGDGFYSYQKMNTEYCIDAGDGGARNQDVYLFPCDANNFNQHWQKVDVDGGAFQLVKRNNSFAINGGSNGQNAQNVNLWRSGSTSQNLQWIITPIENTAAKSIEGDIATNNVIIYPNPVDTTTVIEGSANSNIIVYDINGRLLMDKVIQSDNEKVDLTSLASGIYYAKIEDSQYTHVIKFVKE